MAPDSPTVSVTGRGSATAAPDRGTIRLECRAERATVADAMADANAAVRLVRAAVAERGIDTGAVPTVGATVRAVERGVRGGLETETDYVASHRLQIGVEDVARLGEVLAAAIAAAGDAARLEGVEVGVADGQSLHAEAREAAWADAVAAAARLAELAGRRLGSVRSVTEGAEAVVAPQRMAATVPVEPAGVEAQAVLRVVWELA